MLVRSEIPSISVMRLKRGPDSSGMRLIIDIVAARVPMSDLDFTPMTVTMRIFVIRYPDARINLRRVAVPTKGILGKICGYAKFFRNQDDVDSHSEVIARWMTRSRSHVAKIHAEMKQYHDGTSM